MVIPRLPSFNRLFFIFSLVLFIATGVYMFFAPAEANAAWYNNSWLYRKKLVIDESKVSGSADLTNFPVLVSRTDHDLQVGAQSDGDDIVFTSADGSTKLDHEIESYNSTTGELVAWVEIPTLDYNDDTTIYMYYGNAAASNQQNATGTWNSNYASVWHLHEDPSTSATAVRDSTSMSNDGDASASMTSDDLIAGKIGRALDFDGGAGDYIVLENGNSYDALTQGVISAWVYVKDDVNTFHDLFSSGPTPDWFEFGVYQGQLHVWSSDGLRGLATTTPITLNNWYYISYAVSGSGNTFYVNGIPQTVNYESGNSSSTTFFDDESSATEYNIGRTVGYSSEDHNGYIDELRIANTHNSADWIATEFANQNDPSSFFKSVSTPQSPVDPELRFSFNEGSGTVANNSGADGVSGTISGASWRTSDYCVSGSCLYFDGTNDVVTTASTTTGVRSVAFWVRPTTTTEQFIEMNGSANITASAGTVSATGFTSPTIYVNGKVASTITANQWNHVVVTTSSSINASAFKIGQVSTNYGQGFFDEVQLYSTQLSASQIAGLYSGGGKQISSVIFGDPSQDFLTDGLVGYWPMDEIVENSCSGGVNDFCDRSGLGNDLTMPSASDFVGSGRFGSSLTQSSDNLDDYAHNPSFTGLSSTKRWAVGGWWRTADVNAYLFDSRSSDANGVGIYTDGADTLKIFVDYGGTTLEKDFTYSVPSIDDNGWRHVMLVRDGDNSISLYVDGVLQTPTVLTANVDISSNSDTWGSVTWGNRHSFNMYIMDGSIDEARVYGRALSAAEVKQLYTWAASPVAHYKLDEKTGTTSVNDSSGNGYTGTMNALSSDDWVPGKYGAAIDFDGANDSVSVADNDAFSANSANQLSVMGWLRADSLASRIEPISKGSSSNYEWGLVVETDGTLRAILYQSGGTNYLQASSSAGAITTNSWFHIALVANLNTPELSLYLNGVNLNTATTPSGTYSNGSAAVRLGERADGTRDLDGALDDVRIYNYARTSDQVVEDMNGGHPTIGTPIGSAVGHWKFNEGFGTTANDSGSLDNDLTLSAASWTSDGKFGKAFNGTGGTWATRADDNDFDFAAADDFTISAWFKSDNASNPGTTEYLLSKSNGTTQGYAIFFQTDGDVLFGIDDDTTWSPDDSVGDVSRDYYDGSWHHVVAIKQGTTKIQIYVDGKLTSEDTSIAATGTLANSTVLAIGDRTGADDGNEFTGDIDEVKIFRSALNQEDIIQEYQGGKSIVMGATSTTSTGSAPSNSAAREYCVPGDVSACNPPVAVWKFDEKQGSTVNDVSGNNQTGTFVGTGVYWGGGKHGAAGVFDGDGPNTHVDISAGVGTPLRTVNSTNEITISAWIYPRSFGGGGFGFILSPGWGVGPSFLLDQSYSTTNGIRFRPGNALNAASSNANTINLNVWQHVAVVYSGVTNGGTFYVNGRNVGTIGDIGEVDNPTDTWDIGNSPNEATRHFDGYIDELKVYNYVRTPAQITWEFNQGAPIAHWKLNESSGTTAYDATGNNNTGTLTNSPTRTSSGKLNSAITFDGADDVINAGSAAMLDDLTEMTVTAWINPTTYGENSYGRIVDKGTDPSSSSGWSIFTCSDGGSMCTNALAFFINFGAGSTGWWSSANNSITTGQWSHIAVTYNRSSTSNDPIIYVNGKPSTLTERNTPSGSASSDAAASVLIGNRNAGERAFNGIIDDVRIYNYILTPEQVKLIMNDGAAVRFN